MRVAGCGGSRTTDRQLLAPSILKSQEAFPSAQQNMAIQRMYADICQIVGDFRDLVGCGVLTCACRRSNTVSTTERKAGGVESVRQA